MTTLGDSMVKVLVIDESEVITTGLKIKLERAGFEVYVAHDVEMVYYYIDELFIDFFAVIMEVDMPNIKSHDKFVEYMTGKLITTILLSAISDNEFISKMLKHDVVDYIIKSREEDLIYAVDMVQRLNVYKEHTVLVIDDSKIAQRTTKKNLEILKFKVLLADDGKEIELRPNSKKRHIVLSNKAEIDVLWRPYNDGYIVTLTLSNQQRIFNSNNSNHTVTIAY
jgi:DNA-binding response OmpR family regulator